MRLATARFAGESLADSGHCCVNGGESGIRTHGAACATLLLSKQAH